MLLVNDLAPAPGSGAEIHIARLGEALEGERHEVRFFAGERTHRGAGKVFDLWDPGARTALRLEAAGFRPDVVHFHNVTRELSASVFGAVRDAARVLTVHDPRILGRPDGPAGAPLDAQPLRAIKTAKAAMERRAAIRHMDGVIALTNAMAEQLRAAGFRTVAIVPNFAPPGPEPGRAPSAGHDVLYAGQLTAAKGCSDLIAAFARVARAHPTSRLIFAGDGPERARLEEQARSAVPGRFTFHGLVGEAEVRALMAESRMLVLPSLGGDVSPNVVVEAAFAGRPIVITAIPGITEFVDEAMFGIVVPPGDVGALVQAMDGLLSNGIRSDDMGRAGRRAALATRTPEVGARATVAVYRDAIERRDRSRNLPSSTRNSDARA